MKSQATMMRTFLFSAILLLSSSVVAQLEPTSAPSFAPTVTSFPTTFDRICDDDKVQRFHTTPTQTEPCIWLAARPEEQLNFCQPGMEAYDMCEETCLKCRDPCKDGSTWFMVDDILRDCTWLSLRFSAQQLVCHSNHAAYFACPETCDVCDRFSPNPTATPTMSEPTPSPTTKAPIVPTPTIGCDDSATETFFVNETNQDEPCVWLASRPEAKVIYCAEDHPSGARSLCEESCGTCSDDCKDFDHRFTINGVLRGCTWLGLRPKMMAMLCRKGGSADLICPETCNVCDSDGDIHTPTQSPNADFCDDDKIGTFFVAETIRFERCVWLRDRPDKQIVYCEQNHPSGAFDLCEETCGKCSDNCEDTDSKYLIDGLIRDCTWLSLRLEDQETQCVSGKDAYELCGETCDVCDGATTSPTPPPTPSPNQYPTTPSPTPVPAPARTHPPGICDDDKSATFFVEESSKLEPCVWLEARTDAQLIYCQVGHPSGAFNLCAESCGKCSDNCADSDSGKFQIDNETRNCLWLRLRPEMQQTQCVAGTDAYLLCGETCDVCDTAIVG